MENHLFFMGYKTNKQRKKKRRKIKRIIPTTLQPKARSKTKRTRYLNLKNMSLFQKEKDCRTKKIIWETIGKINQLGKFSYTTKKKKGGLRFEIRLSIAKCSIVLNG